MQQYRYIQQTAEGRHITDTFYGYDHRLKIHPGQFYDMENISCRDFPLLATRKKRGVVADGLSNPQGLLFKSSPLWVAGTALYHNLAAVSGLTLSAPTVSANNAAPVSPSTGDYWYDTNTGITKKYGGESWAEVSYPGKQLVSMGAYLCIFPDKKWYNTQTGATGSMESTATMPTTGSIDYTPTTMDGTAINPTVSSTAPENPANGDWWLDISGAEHVLWQFSVANGGWQQIQSSYIKIGWTGIGAYFEEGDAVEIAGGIPEVNGSRLITAVDTDTLIVPGTLGAATTMTGSQVTISRTVPDMDFVCEAENRLWGCKYGLVGNEPVNELYCCSLGDFKNWRKYEGVSTDSWAASCGTDGPWTGCINYFGHPTFFKEDHIHVISVSSSGAHSVKDYAFEGVQRGSWRSLAVVGSTLYYKSRNHVCAYQGGLPAVVSDALGEAEYEEATGGALGEYYYLSMRGKAGGWHVFVLDTGSGRWYHEDNRHIISFSQGDGDLYALDAYADILYSVSGLVWTMAGSVGTTEGYDPEYGDTGIEWWARTGILYWQSPDNKYTHRYNLRVQMEPGSSLQIFLRYNSEGDFEAASPEIANNGEYATTKTLTIPVRPHRCDHMEMAVWGIGDVKLYSIARIYQEGSDVNA